MKVDPVETLSPLFKTNSRDSWRDALAHRANERLNAMEGKALQQHLEESLYEERQRLERAPNDSIDVRRADVLSKALIRGHRSDQIESALQMVMAWTDEIHGRFSNLNKPNRIK